MFNSKQNNAKFTFFYLLSLVSLVSLVVSVGLIIFQLIDKNIPDVLNQFIYSSSELKNAIAFLLVFAPLYYFMEWQINKNLMRGDLDKEAPVRRWLTYLILLVSSVVAVGWLVAVVYNFLDGGLGLRFAAKAFAAILIAGTVFLYYFWNIRREKVENKKEKFILYFFYGTVSFILVSLVLSIFFIESPFDARKRKLDQMVLGKFYEIDSALNTYYAGHKDLPKTLEELKDEVSYLSSGSIKNPITGQNIEYRFLGDRKYELCADFNLSNKEKGFQNQYPDDAWPHEAGYQCLSKKVLEPGQTIDGAIKTLPVR